MIEYLLLYNHRIIGGFFVILDKHHAYLNENQISPFLKLQKSFIMDKISENNFKNPKNSWDFILSKFCFFLAFFEKFFIMQKLLYHNS